MLLPYACLCCARWIWSADGLCSDCADAWHARREPVSRNYGDQTPFRTRALFPWHEHGAQGMAWVVRGLKGVEDPRRWRVFASWMLETFGPPPPGASLVPVPARGPRNHALGLCRALAALTGRPIADEIVIKKGPAQKGLGRRERERLRLGRSGNSFTSALIVDDVTTTGATARAAHRALGRPGICEVWCLLDRTSAADRPCGPSGRLL